MSFVKSESISNLAKSLIAAKREFQPVLKSSENPFFKRNGQPSKYADLLSAIGATEDALLKNGIVISQFPVNEGDRVGALTLLIHESGEFWGESFTLPLGDKQNAQTGVAAVTYARRTGYLASLGIAAEDDDGNTAAGRTAPDFDATPDFQEARHTAPPPAARAAKTSAAPKQQQGDLSPTAPKAAPASQPAASAPSAVTTSAPAPVTPSAKPPVAEREPGDEPAIDSLPDEAALNIYRAKFTKLADDLSTTGKLKSSKGLPINRKIHTFMLQTAGAENAAAMTVAQWDRFFAKADATQAQGEGGLVRLANLVNEANGIEVKTK